MAVKLSDKQKKEGWQVVRFGDIAKEVKQSTKTPLEDGLTRYIEIPAEIPGTQYLIIYNHTGAIPEWLISMKDGWGFFCRGSFHLLACAKYIELNPVRSGLVKSLRLEMEQRLYPYK